jgi:hypothetical protein
MPTKRTVISSFKAVADDGSHHEIEVCQSVFSESDAQGDERTVGQSRLRTRDGKPVTQVSPSKYEIAGPPRIRVTACDLDGIGFAVHPPGGRIDCKSCLT